MIRNIILTAIRNLQKNKLYSTINIFGLSIALASFIIIFLLGDNFIKRDKFNENYKHIYRVEQKLRSLSNGKVTNTKTPGPLSNSLIEKYPEIESTTRFLRYSHFISDKDDNKFLQTGAFVDESFFEIFTYNFLHGNSRTPLKSNYGIILTDELAMKLYGKHEVIGKTIRLNNKLDLIVTGIIKKEEKTNFYFTYLLPFDLHKTFTRNDYNYIWEKDSSNVQTLILVPEDDNLIKLENQISDELNKYSDSFKNSTLYLKSLKDINFSGSNETSWKFLLLPITLAILILIIACINFAQLAVAYSTKRAKEVAIRKLNGSKNIHIKMQHIGEAILLAYLSLIVGFILAEIALPIFNKGFSNSLEIEYINNWKFTIFMFIVATITGICSGSYPAFYLSSQKAIDVLKNGIKQGKKGLILNKILVISQSTFAVILVLVTIFLINQINYINSRETGFVQKNILFANFKVNNENEANKIDQFQKLLKQEDFIKNTSISSTIPYAFGEYNYQEIEFETFNNDNKISLQRNEIDHNYINTYGIVIKHGRNFIEGKDESLNCLINESAAKLLGNKDLIGKVIDNKYTIIGIINDYHTYISFENPKPLLLTYKANLPNEMSVISIQLNNNFKDLLSIKKTINSIYQQIFTEDVIETKIIEDEINFYKEYLISAINLMKVFSLITVVISLIGVLGLVTYLTKRRYKEISIRKVMGASAQNIYTLIINQFLRLLLISMFISLPLSYLITNAMLQQFADKVEIVYIWFLLVPIITIIAVILTISIQSIKSASRNPIIALRND